MKKSKLLLSGFCLAMTLTFVSVNSTRVYADNGDPQGSSQSTQSTPQPPPDPGIWAAIGAMLGLW